MSEDCIEKEEIDGLIFCQTVFLCPELYEIYDREGRHVGYARLRFGVLRCDFPDCGGVTIYRKDFESEYLGGFRTEREREKYLKIIAEKLNERLAGIGGRQAIEITACALSGKMRQIRNYG